jgi:hypothetical protein
VPAAHEAPSGEQRSQEERVTNRGCGLKALLVGGFVLGVAVVTAVPAAAQSTIFNIPTTDTVAPKKGYFEIDYLKQLPTPDEPASNWQIFMPRIVAGVAPNVEVGVNFGFTKYSEDGGTYALISPNIKAKFYNNDDAGVAAAVGLIHYTAGNYRDTNADNDFGIIYAEVSKKVKTGNFGPRVHGGIYSSYSYFDDEQVGAILGYEQPVGSKVSVVADWFSGKNFWGYFTPGISITLPRSGLLNIGYSIGNNAWNDDPGNDSHNKAFFIYYGVTFP